MKSRASNTTPREINRWQIGTNVILQTLIVVAIIAMINYVGFTHYKRWDMSRAQKYALSQTTQQLMESLSGKVTFIVFFSPGSPIYQDVANLLKEYQYAARRDVDIEMVDPYRNFTRARELQTQYKFGAEENVIIVDHAGKHKFVSEADMAEIDNSGMMFGQPPRIVAFKGEQAVTSAILEVTEGEQKKVLFLTGYGGAEPGEAGQVRGMSQMLERQNLAVDTLALGSVDEVPEDAGLLVLAGARYDLGERDLALLRKYWEAKGRLLILLNPDADTPRLHAFLKELGITVNDDRVLRTVSIGPMVGILREVQALFQSGHPVTKELEGVGTLFMGNTQSMKIADGDNEVKLVSLVEAAEGYWGESNHIRKEEDPVTFVPSEDNGPPLHLAVAAEKGAVDDQRVQMDSSRLLVVSNSDILLDSTLQAENVDFLLGAVNWLLARESMIGIAPKEVQMFTLNLTDEQIGRLSLLSMVVVPAVVAFFGIFVWWRRRV